MVLDLRQFSVLVLRRYEFLLRAREGLVLQALLGSTLRGAFGHAWKTLMCAASPGARAGCFLKETCQMPGECQYSFFKPLPQPRPLNPTGKSEQKLNEVPRSFIFQPPIPPLTRDVSANATLKVHVPKGGALPFRLTLFDPQRHNLLHIISAVSLMALRGLGVSRVPFELRRVSSLDENERAMTIYEAGVVKMEPHAEKAVELNRLVENRLRELTIRDTLKLRLLTPTRIRREGQVQNHFDFETLIGNLSRRWQLLASFYGSHSIEWDHKALLERAKRVKTGDQRLWFHKADRYSDSQREKIEQGGLLGEITFVGEEIEELLPLIVTGEYLHVGSSTSFGLGRYRIEN